MKAQKLTLFAGLVMGITATIASADCKGGYLWTPGGTTIKITAGDGIADPFTVYPRHVQSQNFAFVITDNDSNVLAYPPGNTFDLEGAGEGICRVYGVAYAGDLDMQTGVSVHSLSASECIAVSRNHITVVRKAVKTVNGGWIISDSRGRSTVHINLSDPYPIRAYTTSKAAPDSSYAYVITDYKGNVLAFPPANQFDFSGAPVGICRVYGISYTGTLDTTTGLSIYDVMSDEDNQELSKNYIRVIRSVKTVHSAPAANHK
ncbi:MAG: hypothetical protein V3V05_12225 [Pontiella sp.]